MLAYASGRHQGDRVETYRRSRSLNDMAAR